MAGDENNLCTTASRHTPTAPAYLPNISKPQPVKLRQHQKPAMPLSLCF